MAIILDGTTGITTPGLSIDSNALSLSTLTATTLKSATSSPPIIQNSSGTEIGTFCRAWVACNGSTTILAAFNVSSITDGGAGAITVNMTNSMPDTNYAVFALNRYRASGSFETIAQTGALSTTAFSLGVADIVSGASVEIPYIAASVFR